MKKAASNLEATFGVIIENISLLNKYFLYKLRKKGVSWRLLLFCAVLSLPSWFAFINIIIIILTRLKHQNL